MAVARAAAAAAGAAAAARRRRGRTRRRARPPAHNPPASPVSERRHAWRLVRGGDRHAAPHLPGRTRGRRRGAPPRGGRARRTEHDPLRAHAAPLAARDCHLARPRRRRRWYPRRGRARRRVGRRPTRAAPLGVRAAVAPPVDRARSARPRRASQRPAPTAGGPLQMLPCDAADADPTPNPLRRSARASRRSSSAGRDSTSRRSPRPPRRPWVADAARVARAGGQVVGGAAQGRGQGRAAAAATRRAEWPLGTGAQPARHELGRRRPDGVVHGLRHAVHQLHAPPHCRLLGLVVCDACSSRRAVLPGQGASGVRVCDAALSIVRHLAVLARRHDGDAETHRKAAAARAGLEAEARGGGARRPLRRRRRRVGVGVVGSRAACVADPPAVRRRRGQGVGGVVRRARGGPGAARARREVWHPQRQGGGLGRRGGRLCEDGQGDPAAGGATVALAALEGAARRIGTRRWRCGRLRRGGAT